MRRGRRPQFFALLAVVCAALAPATPSEFRWVNWSMVGLALFWAVLLGAEVLAGRGKGERGAGL